MYGEMQGDTILIQLDGPDFDDVAKGYNENGLRPINVTGTMTELSGTFLIFSHMLLLNGSFLIGWGYV
jgi:hypothetical protein